MKNDKSSLAHTKPALDGVPNSPRLHRPPRIWPVAQLHFSPQIGLIWAHLCSLRGLRYLNSGGRPCRRQNVGYLRIYALSLFEVDRLESIVVEAS